jgi:hypothetical protein
MEQKVKLQVQRVGPCKRFVGQVDGRAGRSKGRKKGRRRGMPRASQLHAHVASVYWK